MLRGLKKGRAQEQVEIGRARPTVDESSIKAAQISEAQQEQQATPAPHDNLDMQLYQQCLRLFLTGSEALEGHLQALRKRALEGGKGEGAVGGRFDYSLCFEGGESAQGVRREIKKRGRPIMASRRVQEYCMYCPDNEELTLLSASNYVYLALAKYRTFEGMFHLILAPVDHEQTSIGLDEDILTELSNYKKCLIQAFDKVDLQVVFFEQFSRDNSHIYLECLPLPRGKADDLPFFFKQALEDVEGAWTTHRSLLRIERERGGLQKQIPRQIKYFYVDFSNGSGYAHVIENEKFWRRQLAHEVVATALNMELHRVKTTECLGAEEVERKREAFLRLWKPFDWTQLI